MSGRLWDRRARGGAWPGAWRGSRTARFDRDGCGNGQSVNANWIAGTPIARLGPPRPERNRRARAGRARCAGRRAPRGRPAPRRPPAGGCRERLPVQPLPPRLATPLIPHRLQIAKGSRQPRRRGKGRRPPPCGGARAAATWRGRAKEPACTHLEAAALAGTDLRGRGPGGRRGPSLEGGARRARAGGARAGGLGAGAALPGLLGARRWGGDAGPPGRRQCVLIAGMRRRAAAAHGPRRPRRCVACAARAAPGAIPAAAATNAGPARPARGAEGRGRAGGGMDAAAAPGRGQVRCAPAHGRPRRRGQHARVFRLARGARPGRCGAGRHPVATRPPRGLQRRWCRGFVAEAQARCLARRGVRGRFVHHGGVGRSVIWGPAI
jgi:hypothetical protein